MGGKYIEREGRVSKLKQFSEKNSTLGVSQLCKVGALYKMTGIVTNKRKTPVL